ncbi:MAG: hypothetical protein KY466_09400 [Gemmatimonadetes bacterium]|nr:hypothetical protein [Gemmatimonadota bacterium]
MIHFRLLGAVDLRTADGAEVTSVLRQPKRLALFTYLTLASANGFQRRDSLLALFWPELDDSRARAALSRALYRLRDGLGDRAIISRGNGELRIDSQVVRCDALDFQAAMADERLEEAVRLYQGPLLPGFHAGAAAELEGWFSDERDRLARLYAEARQSLARQCETAGDSPGAVDHWRAVANLDPYESATALRLVQALERAGKRAEALRRAASHATLLKAELGVEPGADFNRAVDELRRSKVRLEVLPERATPDPGSSAAVSADQKRGPLTARQRFGPETWIGYSALVIIGMLSITISVITAAMRGTRDSDAGSAQTVQAIPETENGNAIAVLPFANLSTDPEHEYLSEGFAEELRNALAQVPGLRVASRTSSAWLKDRPVDEIGARLQVAHLVEGSVRLAEGRHRLTVRLVSAQNGYQLWWGAYDVAHPNLFSVQEEIARGILDALEARLAHHGDRLTTERATEDAEAYTLYLRGRHYFRKYTEEDLRRSIAFYRQAIERDSGYARAYAGLSEAQNFLGDWVGAEHVYRDALAAARKAVELDPLSPDGHVAYAHLLLWHDWDFGGAEREFRLALELDPSSLAAHEWYSASLTLLERHDDAVAAARRALHLDPFSAAMSLNLAEALRIRGDFDAAVMEAARAVELDSSQARGYGIIMLSRIAQRRYTEAIEYARQAVERGLSQLHLAYALGWAGRHKEAREILRAVEARSQHEYTPPALLAYVHASIGENDRAIELLEQSRRERSALTLYLKGWDWGPLSADPRFVALVRSVWSE